MNDEFDLHCCRPCCRSHRHGRATRRRVTGGACRRSADRRPPGTRSSRPRWTGPSTRSIRRPAAWTSSRRGSRGRRVAVSPVRRRRVSRRFGWRRLGGPARCGRRSGASFSFVAQRAMVLLQLIQRLAQQLLDALARLVRRVRGGDAQEEPEAGPQEEPEQPTSSGRTPPGVHGGKTRKRPRPPGDAAAGQAQPPRRPRPASGAPAAPARRRVPGRLQAGPDGAR